MKFFLFIITLCCGFHLLAQEQQKEVFIIGTMHGVPKIVKNSYKPLLKIAKKYNPEAIYVERVRPDDTLSLKNYYSKFLHFADSLSNLFTIDEVKFNNLQKADLQSLKSDDFAYLANCYIVKRDYANYRYYDYLHQYGVKGARKPLRNENDDITHKLAIALQQRYIFSMDDQQTNPQYFQASRACRRAGRDNGDNKIGNKLNSKDNINSIFASISGRLGKYNNKLKTLELYHLVNSFRYVKNTCEPCDQATDYWDQRNFRMAKNIAEQVKDNAHHKNIVIVGAGHVIGLKEALQKHYPDLTIKLMSDK